MRVWNKLLISYAGYVMEDGTIVGDKGNVDFTKVFFLLLLKTRLQYVMFVL